MRTIRNEHKSPVAENRAICLSSGKGASIRRHQLTSVECQEENQCHKGKGDAGDPRYLLHRLGGALIAVEGNSGADIKDTQIALLKLLYLVIHPAYPILL